MAERDIWARFAEVEKQLEELYEHLGLEMPTPEGSETFSPQVVDLIQQDNLPEAIKVHTQETGMGMAEAKELISASRGRL